MRWHEAWVIACGILFAGCSAVPSSDGTRKSKLADSVSMLQEGMTRAQVEQIIGLPSAVRIYGPRELPRSKPEHLLAYGSKGHGGFAELALVRLGPDDRVVEARTPAVWDGMRPSLKVLPQSIAEAHPVSNIVCIVRSVTYDATIPDHQLQYTVFFSVLNESGTSASIPTPSFPLGRCVALEVYDKRGRLFFRKDDGLRGTVAFGADGSCPTLTLEPHGAANGDTLLWATALDFGEPPVGDYYVRIALPLAPSKQDSKFTVSKAFKFKVWPHRSVSSER